MTSLLKALLLSLLFLLFKPSFAQYTGPLPPAFGGCVGTAFQSEGSPTTLEMVDIASGITTPITIFNISFNAMGFSRNDNRLYAIENTAPNYYATDNLIVIGSDYSYVKIPLTYNRPVDRFSTRSVRVNSGSVSSDGLLFVEDGTSLFKIDVNPASAAFGTVYYSAPISIQFDDWAFGFNSNQYLYAVTNGKLYYKNVTSGVPIQMSTTGQNLPSNEQFGAVYMDNQSNMYVKSNNSGKTYKITNVLDRTAGAAHVVSVFEDNTRTSANNDAAGCSAAAPPIHGDFGDAPDTYSTIGASDGPRHLMPALTNQGTQPPPLVSLGDRTGMTSEVDAEINSTATMDQDNGATPSSIVTTSATNQTISSYSITLNNVYNASGQTAYISGWIDWDNNGSFDAGEIQTATISSSTATNRSVILTWNNVTLTGPTSDAGTYARFRISTRQATILQPTGQAPDGEVEDYYIPYTVVLPVSFGDIKAKILNGQLMINWHTITERNNDHFEIEVSKDGKTFTKAGEMKSKFFSGNVDNADYEFTIDMSDAKMQLGFGIFVLSLLGGIFSARNRKWFATASIAAILFTGFSCSKTTDKIDLPDESKIYVRIAQVDFDGKKSYSKVVTAYKAD